MPHRGAHGTEASRIGFHLYMGSRPNEGAVRQHYDVLVLAAEEHQPPSTHFGPDTKVLRVKLDDAELTARDKMAAVETAHQVADYINRDYRVLVTCNMGVNRSGLITALVLMFQGKSATAAIAQVRKHRKLPAALKRDGFFPLCNAHFTRFLVREAGAIIAQVKHEYGE